MVSFFCPTREQIADQIASMLPLGRAWQTRDTGPEDGFGIGFEPKGFNPSGFQEEERPGSILRQFINALSESFYFVTKRLCDLRLEFWCATKSETTDLWMTEYGLPNPCDPFPDLCVKVAALGGTRCDYYAYLAARAGWRIMCADIDSYCGTKIGGVGSKAGIARPGRYQYGSLRIVVYALQSPAYSASVRQRPMAGRFQAGWRLGCGPDISGLVCVLERVVHAEIEIKYEVVA